MYTSIKMYQYIIKKRETINIKLFKIYKYYMLRKEEHPEQITSRGGLRLRRQYSNQHRPVKGTEFFFQETILTLSN